MPDRSKFIENLTAGVVAIGPDGRIVYANQGAAKILREVNPELLLGRPSTEVLVSIDQLDARGESGQREVALVLRDGTSTVVGYSASAPAPDGTRTVLFQEITAVLELRRERDRLLQMAALGDALPSILHELRNPLAAVTGALEVLVEEAEGAMQEQLHTILWEVRRLNLTLQGVGGLARPMHAERHVAVDLAILEACRILEGNAVRRGIELQTEVPALPLLPLDWGIVSGIVFNLVKNAIEACDAGDTILVSASLEVGDTFELSVSDTGQGMTPDVLARCRQLFFTSKLQGSGIGLALCQQIAESSGGELTIASTPGHGTRVVMSVPLNPARASSPSGAWPVARRPPTAGAGLGVHEAEVAKVTRLSGTSVNKER